MNFIDSLGQRSIVRTPVERAELDHVVHEVDDGVDPRQLLLQLPRVLSQLEAGLASAVPRVVLLRLARVDGLAQAGGLAPQLNQDQNQLLLAFVEQISCCDVGKITAEFLHTKLF